MLALNDSVNLDTSLFRLLLDNLPHSAAALYDDTLRIVCAGGELLPTFGLGDQIEGRHISELFGQAETEMLTRWFVSALSGQPMSTFWPSHDRLLNITIKRVPSTYGTPPMGIVIVQDLEALTAEQAANLQAEHQRASVSKDLEIMQTKARVIERILHEFRNPLAAAASSADILAQYGDTMPAEKRRRHVTRISDEMHHLATILDDILTLVS